MDQVRPHQMHTYTLGDPKSLAFELQGERVNILVGGRRITERDDRPYLLSFVTELATTAEWLRRRLNFLEHESLFNELSVEEGYRALFDAFVDGAQPAFDDAIRKLHFADWGPITDAYLTFLIPRFGRLYLATAPVDGGDVTAVEVIPYDLVSTMRQVSEHLAGWLTMTATARQELKTQIKTAFGSVPFPSHQGLRGSMARDDYATDEEAQSITTGQDILGEWWQIPKDELRSCTLGLSYLDAAGVLFYLPAYLDMALDDVGKKRLWVLQLLDTAIGGDDEPGLRTYKEGQLSRLNHAQRKTCIHTLQFLRLQLTDDPLREHEHERAQIENILNDPYWRAIET